MDMRCLAVCAANAQQMSDASRLVLEAQFRGLARKIDDVGRSAEYCGERLFATKMPKSLEVISVGNNILQMLVRLPDFNAESLRLSDASIATPSSAETSIDSLDEAIALNANYRLQLYHALTSLTEGGRLMDKVRAEGLRFDDAERRSETISAA